MTEQDPPKREIDEGQIPAREWLRRKRKEAYETAKAKARAKRREEKEKRQSDSERERRDRDQELWSALKPASELDEE